MSNVTESLVKKAKLKGIDVLIVGENTLKYKESKFKTWSGKFSYSTRERFIKSLVNLVNEGYPKIRFND